jgi:predicted nucleic-acid-binding protein
MNVVLDTNILVRISIEDDETQTKSASHLFATATTVTIPTSVWCEYVWVLSKLYKHKNEAISAAIRAIVKTSKVIVQNDEIEAGLQMMESGGDFADGVHAYTGWQLAPVQAVFASFDKQTVRRLAGRGLPAMVPDSI